MRPEDSSARKYQGLHYNLIHFYVLQHACNRPTFGLELIEQVAGLGYKVSPGTMYPLLDALERRGLVQSKEVKTTGTSRRMYRATAAGRKACESAKQHVERLLGAILHMK